MRHGSTSVEQISRDGHVVMDAGCILTQTELTQALLAYFPGAYSEGRTVQGLYNGIPYAVYCKNISYLGHPHPLFKKRIQIPGDFAAFYQENTARGVVPLLIGIYYYDGQFLFCDFDTSGYKNHHLNNSSAHVYTNDLLRGKAEGLFQRLDRFENRITIFLPETMDRFFDWKFGVVPAEEPELFRMFDHFFAALPKHWNGIDCYDEMVAANYRNKFQPEWPGYYLEFQFENYLREMGESLDGFVRYAQDKRRDGVDLDLLFPTMGCYGDLKAHSTSSGAILGNDKATVLRLLEDGPVYYIVCFHDTERDLCHGSQVAHHWNRLQGKANLDSYAKKMKHSVHLQSYCILELTRENVCYLRDFRQGHNSGSAKAPRQPKIQIRDSELEYFLVHRMIF